MPRANYQSIAQYIAAQPPPVRPVLRKVRAILRKALPKAVEGISYQIPVFKVDGKMVIYLAGFKRHFGLYPATAHLLRVMKEDLAPRLHGKATLRFSYAEKVPVALITKIAKVRAAEAKARR